MNGYVDRLSGEHARRNSVSVEQLGIDTSVMTSSAQIILATLGLAVAIAFGFGGRDWQPTSSATSPPSAAEALTAIVRILVLQR